MRYIYYNSIDAIFYSSYYSSISIKYFSGKINKEYYKILELFLKELGK